MPVGKLFFRTRVTKGLLNQSNIYTKNSVAGWADAFERYGMSLEDGALEQLMTPAPHKEGESNDEVTANGIAYNGQTLGFKDQKQFSFDVHIIGSNRADYLAKYDLFIAEVLNCGYFQLLTADFPDRVYHLVYRNCQNYSHLDSLAKFTISVKEPHPEIRDFRDPVVWP